MGPRERGGRAMGTRGARACVRGGEGRRLRREGAGGVGAVRAWRECELR